VVQTGEAYENKALDECSSKQLLYRFIERFIGKVNKLKKEMAYQIGDSASFGDSNFISTSRSFSS